MRGISHILMVNCVNVNLAESRITREKGLEVIILLIVTEGGKTRPLWVGPFPGWDSGQGK